MLETETYERNITKIWTQGFLFLAAVWILCKYCVLISLQSKIILRWNKFRNGFLEEILTMKGHEGTRNLS